MMSRKVLSMLCLAIIIAMAGQYQKHIDAYFCRISGGSRTLGCRKIPSNPSRAYPPQPMSSTESSVYKRSDLSIDLRPAKYSFAVPVKIGNQVFDLLLDTGSSDTWVVESFFTCLDDLYGHTVRAYNQSRCAFGPAYKRALDTSFQEISDRSFKVTYSSGDGAGGPLGYTSVRLGEELEIPAQQIGLASAAV